MESSRKGETPDGDAWERYWGDMLRDIFDKCAKELQCDSTLPAAPVSLRVQ